MKLEINYDWKTGKFTHIWRLNDMVLNNQKVKGEVKREIKYLRQMKIEVRHTKTYGMQ